MHVLLHVNLFVRLQEALRFRKGEGSVSTKLVLSDFLHCTKLLVFLVTCNHGNIEIQKNGGAYLEILTHTTFQTNFFLAF